jgi:hypothetical protein
MSNLDLEWESFNANINNIKYTTDFNDTADIKIPKCSPIYISTQTKIAFLNQSVNLQKLFWEIPIINYYLPKDGGIIKKSMKISCKTDDEINSLDKLISTHENIIVHDITKPKKSLKKQKFKDIRKITMGISRKDIISIKKKEKKCFYNCFALIMRIIYNGVYREVHIKVFNTGKLEIPGIQTTELLNITLYKLINLLNTIKDDSVTEFSYQRDRIETVLINSNFNCGFYINRTKLFNILKYTYNIHALYDPCSYPGIQCKFYYNISNPKMDGVCYCSTKCTKRKNLLSDKKNNKFCKEISFMIFRTGSILIVGNCDEDILNIIYEYLKILLKKEFHNIFNGINNEIKKKKELKKRKKQILVSLCK